MRYRADIDGLRAVAVVPVVLYHAQVWPFTGGFVGVDVFFVISGYLITSLIINEIDAGRFSLLNFYQRRCRRILPALYAVMTFCAVAGYLVYTPDDLKRLGEAIVGASLFVSNVVFWWQSGYFGAQFDELPLLHTWSLAVEEQYYVAFPIYLIFVSRFLSSRRRAVTLSLCALSFVFAMWSVHVFPSATFYLAPTRAWELLVGALLAMDLLPEVRGANLRHLAGLAGLALIGVTVILYSERTLFPGATALPPALGTALVIWAGAEGSSIATRLLSLRPIVFIGKISYSLYLWHFSLLAFASYLSVVKLSLLGTASVIALSIGASVLSWSVVEQPFRRPRKPLSPNLRFFTPVTVATCALCAFGLLAYRGDGFPARLTPAAMRILAEADDFDHDRLDCALFGPPVPKGPQCRIGMRSQDPPQFALWGDSHAEAWRPALDDLAGQHGETGIFVGRVACGPLIEVRRADEPNCVTSNAEILQFILSAASVRTVVLSARWGLLAEGSRYKKEHRSPAVVQLLWPDGMPTGPHQNQAVLAFGLRETVAALRAAGKDVWLIGPVPEVGYPVPTAMYIQQLGMQPSLDIRPTRDEYQERQRFVIDLFDRLQNEFKIKIIWPDRALCDERYCNSEHDGRPLYIDDNHLSVYGSKKIESLFSPIFDGRNDGPARD